MYLPLTLGDHKSVSIGSWLQVADPSFTEMMARAGFDWLCVDLEHTTIGPDRAGEAIRIATSCGVPVLVRLSHHSESETKKMLDAGAAGIIAPNVRTPEEARAVVAMASYPPRGRRGVGLARAQGFGLAFADYKARVDDTVVVVPQIEHIDAVDHLDDILAVEGVSGFFVGPYDLSGSVGLPGQFDAPEVAAALDRVKDRIRSDGKPAGIHVVDPDPDQLAGAVADGYRFIAYASDMLFMSHRLAAVTAEVDRARNQR